MLNLVSLEKGFKLTDVQQGQVESNASRFTSNSPNHFANQSLHFLFSLFQQPVETHLHNPSSHFRRITAAIAPVVICSILVNPCLPSEDLCDRIVI